MIQMLFPCVFIVSAMGVLMRMERQNCLNAIWSIIIALRGARVMEFKLSTIAYRQTIRSMGDSYHVHENDNN